MRSTTKWLPRVLLLLGMVALANGAQAQALPVPGASNPDWLLEKTAPQPAYQGPRKLFVSNDRMPNAIQQSVSSNGSRSYQWDGARQLAYEWPNRTGSMGPYTLVTVRDDRTGTPYTYRRRTPLHDARQWHRLPRASPK